LTHDLKQVARYEEDPLIFHHVAARWFTEIQKAYEEAIHIAPHLKIPLLLQLSNSDRIVDAQQSLLWYQKCTMLDRKQLIYDGFFHEIYNETECERPIKDAINWLKIRQVSIKKPIKVKAKESSGAFV
jgi:lysophospholipase